MNKTISDNARFYVKQKTECRDSCGRVCARLEKELSEIKLELQKGASCVRPGGQAFQNGTALGGDERGLLETQNGSCVGVSAW